MKKDSKLKESDLYPPVKSFFEEHGYKVGGEVKSCDIALVKDDELAIVELKLSFSLELVFQAIDRQKVCNTVYVAVPKPKKIFSSRCKSMLSLARRLDLGLIFVKLEPVQLVEIVVAPKSPKKITGKGKRRQSSIKKELDQREFDLAIGGVTGKKIPTAYREQAIKILCIMAKLGTSSAANLRKNYGCSDNTLAVLSRNYYGWFVNVERGVYGVTKSGLAFLKKGEFREIVSFYKNECD